MKRASIAVIALFAGFTLAGTAFAQRHDEKPHGYDKAKAEATAAGTSETAKSTGSGGRHDEKPHGMAKKATPTPTTAKKPATAAPAVATPGNAKSEQ